jgi:4-oxalocrotonate tautomerase
MLILKVTMLEGRTVDQKAELIRRLTASATHRLGEAAGDIRIIIYEVPPTNWGAGGVTIQARSQNQSSRSEPVDQK